ncbi:MAG: hypothetical protein KGJ03_10195 [Betaproteobacteria bacterium]|jgi:hypothetical protein|nr:hypothetical protein [Betaproteobacteria bacterium]MBU6512448.1 hypothetical protein [Betaproteobacteria bacterium]MDE1956083.1 hypothetical protein [Betaproteobacteria bacterium]MDE2152662.1 hypothetical protein [Betaproteobacteria bacterium]MDE2478310.1 hypothetical protein [Betaproteobacteria bacterium]
MRHPDHLAGILTLPTLLRLSAALGSGMGVISGLGALYMYRHELGLGQAPGVLLGGVLFNALALMFATLLGYWPYRALARRRRFGLHRLSVYLLTAD